MKPSKSNRQDRATRRATSEKTESSKQSARKGRDHVDSAKVTCPDRSQDEDIPKISGWNYRVIRISEDTYKTYGIREVHYADDGSIIGWTGKSATPYGESLKELQKDMEHMAMAFRRPILEQKMIDGKEMLVPVKRNKNDSAEKKNNSMRTFKSDALKVLHETLTGLHKTGMISDNAMREFDRICFSRGEESKRLGFAPGAITIDEKFFEPLPDDLFETKHTIPPVRKRRSE